MAFSKFCEESTAVATICHAGISLAEALCPRLATLWILFTGPLTFSRGGSFTSSNPQKCSEIVLELSRLYLVTALNHKELQEELPEIQTVLEC